MRNITTIKKRSTIYLHVQGRTPATMHTCCFFGRMRAALHMGPPFAAQELPEFGSRGDALHVRNQHHERAMELQY